MVLGTTANYTELAFAAESSGQLSLAVLGSVDFRASSLLGVLGCVGVARCGGGRIHFQRTWTGTETPVQTSLCSAQ